MISTTCSYSSASFARARLCKVAMFIVSGLTGLPEAWAQITLEDYLRRRPLISILDTLQSATPVKVPEGWTPTTPVLHSFTPNDPYYTTGNPVGFPGQWHLDKQTSGAAYDVNIAGAWSRGLTGQGVTIGIVDNGVEHTHPDLSPNYVADDSYDFADNDPDPSPVFSNTGVNTGDGDNHGTSVGGIAAARGGNALGVTGAAPYAGLAAMRVDLSASGLDGQQLIDATLYHSSGANTNISIKNHSYSVRSPYLPLPAEVNAVITSHDAGTIHIFSAGNNRDSHSFGGTCCYFDDNQNNMFDPDLDLAISGDANTKHLQSIQETIPVAALGSNGVFTSYSNWGANVWVTAPSGDDNLFEITTTDRTGGDSGTGGYNNSAGNPDDDSFPDLDYTSTFSGTSASAPLVAGIMALGKQAQPNLNTRFAKHLLAKTSVVVDPGNVDYTGAWLTNGAGYNFNPNYGFGLIDADAFTLEAVKYTGVSPLTTESNAFQPVNRAIPADDPFGIFEDFTLTGQDPLEEIEIHLNIEHTWRGQVEAYLVSPSGMFSLLTYFNGNDSFDTLDWTFVTNAFWGEIPAGDWRLIVADVIADDDFTGSWLGYSVLAKMGTLVPEPSSLSIAVLGLLAMFVSHRCRRQ